MCSWKEKELGFGCSPRDGDAFQERNLAQQQYGLKPQATFTDIAAAMQPEQSDLFGQPDPSVERESLGSYLAHVQEEGRF